MTRQKEGDIVQEKLVNNSTRERTLKIKQFEVGKSYEPSDSGFPPVTIMKRTAKMILVRGEAGNWWRMRIRTDEDGNEYMTDSSVPAKWRDVLTYSAKWEVR